MFTLRVQNLLTTYSGCQPPPPVEYEYTELLPEGWRNGSVVDINDKGEVIGDGKDSNGAGKTFLYSNGEYKEILPPGSEYFYAVAINNSGEVIGTDGHGGTFIYCGGTYREVTFSCRVGIFRCRRYK